LKNIELIFVRLFPVSIFVTLTAVYVTNAMNSERCPDLTFGFLWELVPVWGFIVIYPASIAVFDMFLKSKGDSIFSLYGVGMWTAIVHGLFLIPFSLAIFPAERFFNTGATCNFYGENYFESVFSPFVVTQIVAWIVALALISWMVDIAKTKQRKI
jgi:hypothetical protein